jgi:predicted nucleic acid-binding protein
VIAYVDSSVLLRFILDQPQPLAELLQADGRVTSHITEVECLRAVETAHARGQLDIDDYAERRRLVYAQLRRMRRLALTRSVLWRAGEPYRLPVKSLDALHLASALVLREREAPDLVFATHDRQLGRLAAVLDFPVIGL